MDELKFMMDSDELRFKSELEQDKKDALRDRVDSLIKRVKNDD